MSWFARNNLARTISGLEWAAKFKDRKMVMKHNIGIAKQCICDIFIIHHSLVESINTNFVGKELSLSQM